MINLVQKLTFFGLNIFIIKNFLQLKNKTGTKIKNKTSTNK